MTPLSWMVGASVLAWLVVATLGGSRVNPEALLGMIGALASESVTWVVIARTQAAAPERVMGVMVAALAAKMVSFLVYVLVMVRLFEMRPVPFVVSLAGCYIGLHMMEALFLRRLFVNDARSSSSASPL